MSDYDNSQEPNTPETPNPDVAAAVTERIKELNIHLTEDSQGIETLLRKEAVELINDILYKNDINIILTPENIKLAIKSTGEAQDTINNLEHRNIRIHVPYDEERKYSEGSIITALKGENGQGLFPRATPRERLGNQDNDIMITTGYIERTLIGKMTDIIPSVRRSKHPSEIGSNVFNIIEKTLIKNPELYSKCCEAFSDTTNNSQTLGDALAAIAYIPDDMMHARLTAIEQQIRSGLSQNLTMGEDPAIAEVYNIFDVAHDMVNKLQNVKSLGTVRTK